MTVEACQRWLAEAQQVVGFSGAGISTASGIPDFRSPGGVWSTNRTVTYQEFVASEDDRIEYWRQKVAIWPEMCDAKPNAGHLAFKQLDVAGKFLGMITQNIDGLFQKVGLADEKIIELHGTTVEVVCLTCGERSSMDAACKRVEAGDLAPKCEACMGLLKPATVSFGQAMPMDEMDRARDLCYRADVMIAVGSSLVVQPAASFPLIAKQNGARLIIINRDETPFDSYADFVSHGEISEVLPELL